MFERFLAWHGWNTSGESGADLQNLEIWSRILSTSQRRLISCLLISCSRFSRSFAEVFWPVKCLLEGQGRQWNAHQGKSGRIPAEGAKDHMVDAKFLYRFR